MNYSPEVLQRFGLPQADGAFPDETEGVVRGEAEDRSLGIWVRFDVRVHEGLIRAARFRLFGCPHAIAAASLICERLEDQPARSLSAIDLRVVAESIDLPVEKYGKLLKIEDALLECWRSLGDSRATSEPGNSRHPGETKDS